RMVSETLNFHYKTVGIGKTLFRTFSNLYFSIFAIVASAVFVMQKMEVQLHPIISNYLNDFLCMPIVLSIAQYMVRKIKSNDQLQLPLSLILMVSIGYAVYFEYYLPQVHTRYTADPLDVTLYFMGAAFFYLMERYKVAVMTSD
ncbi:MAG: hypothetical protein WBG48_13265, partial [Pricia sp.]